ncbi:hypothetical protein [Heterosigma akashiwo virus 01]|jgi:hypothetical protein|uniref:Uncharacterized protein n=1 Tax=Heterosigma akashiwo virus 01 TaxID=97195 RepID=A0A1C9C554_HAV01|nr:hypothetical protein D1R72_gp089 [Heterosigma akashiwo virus 01]AOM63420.1 hypothetical protein [Heterosigma akashiwo virus 01]
MTVKRNYLNVCSLMYPVIGDPRRMKCYKIQITFFVGLIMLVMLVAGLLRLFSPLLFIKIFPPHKSSRDKILTNMEKKGQIPISKKSVKKEPVRKPRSKKRSRLMHSLIGYKGQFSQVKLPFKKEEIPIYFTVIIIFIMIFKFMNYS